MAQDTASGFSQPLPSQDLRTLQRQWLCILYGLLLVAMSLLWLSEAQLRHEVGPIDRIAYPIVLSSMSISLAILRWRPQHYTLAVMGTVGVGTLYMVTFLQAIIWGYIPLQDDYSLATFTQWFPITYIALFLFLSKNQAVGLSLCIYASLAMPTVIIGYLERQLPGAEQKFPYLLHMLMSHPVYIAVFTAVATLQMSFAQAKTEAVKADLDYLTNLANRRAATRTLEAALHQTAEELCVGVILADIDRFKAINDTFGHGVGDRVLIQVAQLLQQDLRKTDLAARWGGEEFLVVLAPTTSEDVAQTAERLRAALAAYVHSDVGQVTASFGIATTAVGEGLESLIQRADKALYTAKQQGRNRVVWAVTDLVTLQA